MSQLNALHVRAASSGSPLRASAAVYRRAARVLAGVGLVHALLAATHGGEFWPFSIYPMFSQAGRSWARALVVEAQPGAERRALAAEYSLDDLPGVPFELYQHGIPQNDLSSLVQRADAWGAAEIEALRQLFGAVTGRRTLVVLVVRGTLVQGTLQYTATPVAALRCDQGRVDVELPRPLPEAANRHEGAR